MRKMDSFNQEPTLMKISAVCLLGLGVCYFQALHVKNQEFSNSSSKPVNQLIILSCLELYCMLCKVCFKR